MRVHLGRPRLAHRRETVAAARTVLVAAAPRDRRGGAAAELAQSSAEVSPKDAVDDEVDGRVCGHDDVAYVVVVVVRAAARVRDADHVDELVDERRSLTDEEDEDDDDHHLHK